MDPCFAFIEEYFLGNAPPPSLERQDITLPRLDPVKGGGVMFAQGYPSGQQMNDIRGLDGYGCYPLQVGLGGRDLL